MNKILFFGFLSISIVFFTFADVPIKKIEAELSQAEKDFEKAKKMFNPWYSGPLLTGSGTVYSPGYVNINPVIQMTDNWGVYDKDRHVKNVSDLNSLNPSLLIGVGVVNRLEAVAIFQGFYQTLENARATTFGDTSLRLGIALAKEGPYVPAMKLSFKEIFPTGKYRDLNPNKASVQGTGSGSYKTEVLFAMSKVVWWWLTHPMSFRLMLDYGIPARVHVKNFNSYGGGFDTNGHIRPGNYFKIDFGYELSFTQKVAFAIDLDYEYANKTSKFKGNRGRALDGDIARIGGPSNDFLSIAPAIEYNFTPDISLLAGFWFTVYGRNTSDFMAGLINFSYGF